MVTHHSATRWCSTSLVLQVRAFLDRTFPARWISRDGPMPWSPRSLDITPLDFFLWGYFKSNVFRTPVNGLDDLKTRIGMRSRLFLRTWSTEHGKSSNMVWTFSVLPRQPTSSSTEVMKNINSFAMTCRKANVASSIHLRVTSFQIPEGTS
jgi:hypothetical protein